MVIAPYEPPASGEFLCGPVTRESDRPVTPDISHARKCLFGSEDDRGMWTYELSLVTMTDESLPDERESVVMGRMTVVLVPHQ